MPRKPVSRVLEWSVGITSLPSYVHEDGTPYRPDILIWLDEEGLIIGNLMEKSGDILAGAADSLRQTCSQPVTGKPRRPTRIRTSSAPLIEALRPHFPDIEFVLGPAPDFDAAATAMRERFNEPDPDDPPSSWLGGDVDAEATASFFSAAAALYRVRPWMSIEGDTDIFLVTIDALGLHEAALSIIGQAGQSFGFLLFPDGIVAFDYYMQLAQHFEPGMRPAGIPLHMALNFERGADQDDDTRKEIAAYGWEVAGPAAYPWLAVIDEDLVARGPTRRELATVEAIARALPQVLQEKPEALAEAWRTGVTETRQVRVKTAQGDVEVILSTATEDDLPFDEDPLELLTELHAVWQAELDGKARPADRIELVDEFVDMFRASEEAAGLPRVIWTELLMGVAMFERGESLLDLTGASLRKLLFETIAPRVAMPAGEAPAAIAELRALFRFLQRAADMKSAQGCLRVLGATAESRLATVLESNRKPAPSGRGRRRGR